MDLTPASVESAAADSAGHVRPSAVTGRRAIDIARPLRRDIRLMRMQLSRVIRRHGGPGLYELLRRVCDLAQRSDGVWETLRAELTKLSDADLGELARALMAELDVWNLAEDRHRVRILRRREMRRGESARPESIAAAVQSLRQHGLAPADVQRILARLDIELVLTAHPTEAKRRTIRRSLGRLRRDLMALDQPGLLPRQRRQLLRDMLGDLATLWETETLLPRRPSVLDEVRRGLHVFDPLWEVAPRLFRQAREALDAVYPEQSIPLGRLVRFGSWIGGDRDGNPFVTAEVTQTTLTRMRDAAMTKHLAACQELQTRCSISRRRHGVSQALLRSLDRYTTRWAELAARVAVMHPDEIYRQWLTAVTFRLEKTAAAQAGESPPQGAYPSARELAADLELLAQSLRHNGHEELADGGVQDWLDRIEVFGFHFARLDIREDARAVREAVGEVLRLMGRCDDLAALDEEAKLAVLSEPIPSEAAGKLILDALTGPSRDLVEVFRHLQDAGRDFGQAALGVTIASMTHHASDVLAMLWLQRLGAAICSFSQSEGHDQILLPVVPLFETIDDLRRAGPMIQDLLACPSYRAHVQRHGRLQMVMVGYSDSTKDGGYLSANWSLYQAEDQVTRIAERAGISVVFFHGRGGALGRGGGPAAQGILSLPPHSVQGRIRITEQGEVLAERYDDPEIALRHLEQMVWATLLVDVVGAKEPPAEWATLLGEAATASYAAYRQLVEDPGFVSYFEQATPIAGIEGLPIASRPSRRRTQRTIADLRAIPYTFAWTQSRQVITAFYGLGTALEPLLPAKLDLLRQMYRQWPFFKAVIDNAELAVAKCEPTIAAEYAQLVEDRDASFRIYSLIQSELARTRAAVLAVTGHAQLLDAVPWLQQSIAVRNPYVAAMNLIQVELLRRRRVVLAESLAGQDPPAAWPGLDRITELLRLSIQAVAAGVRTTG